MPFDALPHMQCTFEQGFVSGVAPKLKQLMCLARKASVGSNSLWWRVFGGD